MLASNACYLPLRLALDGMEIGLGLLIILILRSLKSAKFLFASFLDAAHQPTVHAIVAVRCFGAEVIVVAGRL